MEPGMSRAEIAELEDVAARAVPAAHAVEVGGWLLRSTPELTTKRANSVLARAGTSTGGALEERLATVETFYADLGLPARYQLCPASCPPGLRSVLTDRGYRVSAPTDVELAPLADAARLPAPRELEVRVAATAGEPWWRTWGNATEASRERAAGVAALFERISGETAFACVHRRGGAVVAVGMAVRDGRRVGIFNMATLPEHRGRGAGRAALLALAGWGQARSAGVGYLQVEADNAPARALYHRAGFRPAYQYVYLTQTAQ